MKNKIKEIFIGNNFKSINLDLGTLYICNNIKEESYWFVVEDDLETILDKQELFFNVCKKYIKLKSFDKNCNLIVLSEIKYKNFKNIIKNKIIKIEADPYIFRKYVIYYNRSELNELESLVNNQSLNKFIDNNICKPSFFSSYKNNESEFSGYALLYRIMIKLPFVEININEINSLNNIEENINKRLIEKNIIKDYEMIFETIDSYKSNELLEFDSEDLLYLIIGKNGDEINDYKD